MEPIGNEMDDIIKEKPEREQEILSDGANQKPFKSEVNYQQ